MIHLLLGSGTAHFPDGFIHGGSPPSAVGILTSQAGHGHLLAADFAHWQHWAAQTFQNQLSNPVVAYFRLPRKNQSWLASLVAILDAASVAGLCADGELRGQAEAVFAICRHAIVDRNGIFATRRVQQPEPA